MRGKKHKLKYHLIRDEINGLIDIWVDGRQVYHYVGETKFLQERFDWVPMNHYCDPNETENTVYFDNVILATAEADLNVFGMPEPEEPEPSGDSRFLYWSLLGVLGILLIVFLMSLEGKKND